MRARITFAFSLLASIAMSCQGDVRRARCDPFRTPRVIGPPVTKSEEKTAHAPWSAGDCMACHVAAIPIAGESLEDARQRMGLIRPVNAHCAACHKELFIRPPPNHPGEKAFCASCHSPHNSRLPSLLRDEDFSRACLDHDPPYPEPPAPVASAAAVTTPAIGATTNSKPAAKKRGKKKKHTRKADP